MSGLLYLIPIALFLGLLGLGAFLWALRSGQFDDLDGAAERRAHPVRRRGVTAQIPGPAAPSASARMRSIRQSAISCRPGSPISPSRLKRLSVRLTVSMVRPR